MHSEVSYFTTQPAGAKLTMAGSVEGATPTVRNDVEWEPKKRVLFACAGHLLRLLYGYFV